MLKKNINSEKECKILGCNISNKLKAGDVISLEGNLGSGKTTFVKGILQGLNYKYDVTSPTFTLINEYDAEQLMKNGCICVSEGANMPCTAEAISIFKAAKILDAPGKASNAGGVATSGLEMSQNSLRLHWSVDEVDMKLKDIMKNIHTTCLEHGKEKDFINYFKGANVASFIKVAEAMIDQGSV